MYCLVLIKLDVSNTSYYVEVENGAVLCDVARSWKRSLEAMESHEKVMENFYGKSV